MNSGLIAIHIIKRVIRNPKEVMVVLVLPIVLIIIFSATMQGQGAAPVIGLVIQNEDDSASKWLMERLQAEPSYKVIQISEDDYARQIEENQISMAVILPNDLSARILNGETQVLPAFSKSQNLTYKGFTQKAEAYLSELYRTALAAKKLSAQDGQGTQEHFIKLMNTLGNNGVHIKKANLDGQLIKDNTIVITSIGFAIMFIMLLIFLTLGIILEDKRKLTLARMFVLPVKEGEIIIGNLLGSTLLGLFQLIPLTIALGVVFQFTLVQMLGIFVVLLCFLVAAVGLGIGISGLIKNSFNPVNIIATVITPTCILGGCFIPQSMLPEAINKAGYLVPQKWAIGAITSILNGSGFQTILLNLFILILFGLVLATFGLKTIRPIQE